jgi:hypothetical protein
MVHKFHAQGHQCEPAELPASAEQNRDKEFDLVPIELPGNA